MSAENISAGSGEYDIADNGANGDGSDHVKLVDGLNAQTEDAEVSVAESNKLPKAETLMMESEAPSGSGSKTDAVDDVNQQHTLQGETDLIHRNNIETESETSGTSEDNLHGLSITATQDDSEVAECEGTVSPQQQENHDMKAERVNPFNASPWECRRRHSIEHQEPMAKFISLAGSPGNDGNAASLAPHELSLEKMQLSEELAQLKNMAPQAIEQENHSCVAGASSLTNGLPEHLTDSPSKKVASDPWVSRISPKPAITPSEEGAEMPVEASAEVEHNISPQNGSKCTPNSQPLCLEGELKKAPAIDANSVLSPVEMNIPGPCEPEDLIEGIIFSANYLGTTQLASSRNSAKNTRMLQAQEAVNRIKAPDGESQPTVEVDLFISTVKIKILNADTQETMMSHTLRSISYIADIGDVLVIMAKRPASDEEQGQNGEGVVRKDQPKHHRIICHVLSSTDSHLIAESIGQCFNVSYQQFLRNNCIEPQNLTQDDFNQLLDTQEMYHDDLVHYSKQENIKEIWVEKKSGETMGIAIVESGWGSIIPTVILANLQHGSPVERNGKFSIGDQIMAINGTSMVGLPLQTCHGLIKGLRNQTLVKINIVSCPPVVSVLIKRPNLKHQLGFSVQNGIICSLMRGGIAERGGVRVGHRIIEINNQSVVATPHDKIVQTLTTSVGEIQMKTMPAAMYRLLTGQEQPVYL